MIYREIYGNSIRYKEEYLLELETFIRAREKEAMGERKNARGSDFA